VADLFIVGLEGSRKVVDVGVGGNGGVPLHCGGESIGHRCV